MSRRRALGMCLAGLVLLAGCGGGDDAPTVGAGTSATSSAAPAPATDNVVSVTFRGGTVAGASRQRAPVNQPVVVRVTSDVADEVHVHGYDKHAAVAAGGTVDIRFDADIPGVFEVELERAHKLLFTLEVR